MKKIYKPFNRLVVTGMFLTSCFLSFAGQFSVINTNNAGAGSLADAITQANTTPGIDTITFALPGGVSLTIAPSTAFPAITEALFVDGYSQLGAVQGTIASRTIQINIDGTGLPGGADIFTVNTTGVIIAGFALYKAPSAAIRINNGANAFVWGNYIGTDSTGLVTGLGNSVSGIECNTFSGIPNTGIKIGVDGNGINDANEGNLICSSGFDGIFFWRTESSIIAGNIIGFNKNGVGAGFGNLRNGILATSSSNSNIIGTNGNAQSDNFEGNRIGNNTGRGIFVATISNLNIIAGNTIGLDASNNAAGNGESGIEINPGSSNRIGTDANGTSDALERNTICSNLKDGIKIVGGDFFGGSNSNDNIISGNSIGTNGAGTLVRGNTLNGITLSSNNNFNTNDNIIGSNGDFVRDDLEGNIVANNAKGIVLETPGGTSTLLGNRISYNSIYDNTQLGIDLSDNGVTADDNGDADTGPNELMNFPFITKANVQGGNLVVTGIAPADAYLEFYIADALGSEGKTFLFTAQVNQNYNGINDDSTGTASYNDVTYGIGTDEKFGFSVPVVGLPVSVPAGSIIVALSIKSTASINSTSEFGPAFVSTLPVRLVQFNGSINNGTINLNWITSQEQNNSHFEIERSADGTSFEKIGRISAQSGLTNTYSFIDTKPGLINFYRLKQIDKNGTSTYSKVLLIRGDLDKIAAKIAPNPFRASLNISFQLVKGELVTLRLFNQTGQLVKQQVSKATVGINTINLGELNNLPAGNYTLEIAGESIRFKQQVIKQ